MTNKEAIKSLQALKEVQTAWAVIFANDPANKTADVVEYAASMLRNVKAIDIGIACINATELATAKPEKPKHKFKVGEYVAIHGGPYYGENGRVTELLVGHMTGTLSYAIKITTGQHIGTKGTTVIDESDLRKE